MKLIDVGTSGVCGRPEIESWISLGVPPHFLPVCDLLSGGTSPRPVQIAALRKGVLTGRRHCVVSAPTNSGKTLIGYLVLLDALSRGRRAVLVEPLRALAREKADELEGLVPMLTKAIGRPFTLRVSTGDYRLEGETFSDPAPGAELIIATPERLESILRVPENEAWFADLGAVCVDEAHLLSQPRRGATLEYLITSLLTLPAPPRLVLLSATMGGTDKVAEWLHPCDVVSITERTPPLDRWMAELGEGEDANACVAQWLKDELAAPGAQALVFIHQARQTAGAAAQYSSLLGDLAGPAGALPYNSQMPPAQREQVREQFVSGASRVVVTTSALGMGVNLPATHVVVRDLTYIGAHSPGVGEILQMMGRAGRGDRVGKALVVKRPSDHWVTSELVEALRHETLPPLTSALAVSDRARDPHLPPPATESIASLLLRAGKVGKTVGELETFFYRSFGGRAIASQVTEALRWLQGELLVFHDEADGKRKLTTLGAATVRAVLPLRVGAGFARLLRDLMSLAEDEETLGRWTPLDFLIAIELLHNTPSLRRFSGDLADQVVTWCESHSTQVPLLFRRWLRGQKAHSNAVEVLGTIGVEPKDNVADREEWARQRGFVATFNAIVLYERAMGRSVIDLERQYAIANLEGIEERWRDTILWLLAGLIQLLDVKVFYYHLCEDCGANAERVKTVKHHLATMRWQGLELVEQVKFASPLGALILAMRRRKGKAGVGIESIRKLEDAGVTQLAQVANLSPDQFAAYGVRKDIAKRIIGHLKQITL